MMLEKLKHSFIPTNGIRLHVVEAGREDGPLVILLHGFPEFWYGWRKQIDFLAEAGYHVLVPDLRGYNLSDKPPGIRSYHLDKLARDIIGLMENSENVTLIGHDWGGVVAWWTAIKFKERLQKLVILNAPHPVVMRRNLVKNKAQRKKSWYIFYFQLPRLPERMMSKNNWEFAVRSLVRSSRAGTFGEEDLQKYREAWSQPGAIKGMLNYYRASFRPMHSGLNNPRIQAPVLIIWGSRDRFLGRELAEQSLELCDKGRIEYIEEATHWVQHEEPGRVNALIGEFLTRAS